MKKILYLRNAPYKVNVNSYNLQEIGFSKALCKRGFDCDIVYYSDKNETIDFYEDKKNGAKIRIIFKKGIKFFRTGIYKSLLNKDLLNKYDIIITTEYSQIMSALIRDIFHGKLVLYTGPYYNMFKIKFLSPIYDFLFRKKINSIKYKFCKSDLAKSYLEKKGYTDLRVLGVGLDLSRFNDNVEKNQKTESAIKFMNKKNNLLYVGALNKRKNINFLLKVYEELYKNDKDLTLTIIGNGNSRYIRKIKSINNKSINYINNIDNSQLKYIYPMSQLLILPSKLEIFGMVLLEALYFGVPIVSSKNGGSVSLISDNDCGVVIEKFNIKIWKDTIYRILKDKAEINKMKVNSKYKILYKYNWDSITDKFLKIIEEENSNE